MLRLEEGLTCYVKLVPLGWTPKQKLIKFGTFQGYDHMAELLVKTRYAVF